ncbi:uncharacterized protein LOC124292412 [Haliotis rubra]|uniref:uncharacterized protein LOC124292412 n=1 Tax=Haliotis rubra TaxID=36100 RepID=UPI001EE52D11|nr:uncharacterized protein LOC124292412 [Haliotis rubra]XP_046585448.1 uncharacterized protein LOC124292412 [Haliotis rubra]
MMWDSARGLIAATVWVLLVWQSSCHHPKLKGRMTATNTFRLRCTKTGGWGITGLFSVYWYRNDTLVFETYKRIRSYVHILDNSFEKSVHLNMAWRTHTVTVSHVHEGMSIWRCNNNKDTATWSKPIKLSSNTAGVTPFTPITQTPFEGNVTLNVYPDKIFDDGNLTVSCTVETGGQFNISNMVWLQNSEEIFVTFSNGSHLVLDNSTKPAVMDVTQSYNQHNVTMVASLYDAMNGTEWTCGIPVFSTMSNTVFIQVLEPTGNVSLDVYPGEVQKGTGYSLSCTVKTEDPVRASPMTWRQNCEEYIVTFGNGSYDIVGNSTSTVIGEIKASNSQHNLTLLAINDDSKSTTWTCGIEKWQWYSNNVSITVRKHFSTTPGVTGSPPTSDSNKGHQSVEDRTQLYTILGCTVGAVALTVVIFVIVIRNRKKAGEIKEQRGPGHESAPCVEDADVLEMKDNVIYESSPNDKQDDEKVMADTVLYESSPADGQDVDRDKVMADNVLYESSPADGQDVDRDKVMADNVLYESSPADGQDVDRDKVMKENDLYESTPTDVHHDDNKGSSDGDNGSNVGSGAT